ncbi:multidrug effflux MFS transporter [Hansschlegelia plantiphila]|uniref:Bcr/CflA family efflux transporter n=1 Tax=Hansschlegelia plantiphila TaxID=374655 RepID=A0A9W6IZB7_9HYPH|nr:multidrug effflux MFS transporter [Hansschlegelia plantiphila]GLK66548.1 Bcr/CflA family drug resistance efflux transporter [Hansschlegelia plantiphila]
MRLRPDTLALTAVLAMLTAVGPLAIDMYLPSLPHLTRALGASPTQGQLTLSAFLVGFAAGQVVYGPLSDARGRKPVLMASLTLFTFGSALCALAPTIETLIVARFLQALGGAGPVVLARSIVRDLYSGPRAARELARMATILGLIPAVAPLIGGVLESAFNWRATFVLLTLLLGGEMLIVAAFLPETIRLRAVGAVTPRSVAASYAVLLRHKGFLTYLGLTAIAFAGLFAYISTSSFILQSIYGLSEIAYGAAFAIGVIGYVGGTLAAGPLVRLRGLDGAIGVGSAAVALGGLLMLALVLFGPQTPAAIVGPMMVYMFGVGLVMPQSMACALQPFPERAGAASSLVGFAQMTFGAIVGVGLGRTLSLGTVLPLPIAVSLFGVATLALFRLSRKARRSGA